MDHVDDEASLYGTLSGTHRLEEMYDAIKVTDPYLQVWSIKEPLQGDLDLGFLGPDSLIEEIQFTPGQGDRKITSLTDLPPRLRRLTCCRQALRSLGELPSTLEELVVSHNKLSTLDFSHTPQLRVFRGDHNQLYQLDNLPASLEELVVDNNRLSRIDLLGLTELKVLHCTHNNHPLVLEHYPMGNTKSMDLKMDEDVLSLTGILQGGAKGDSDDEEGDDKATPDRPKTKKPTFQDALNQYFALKTKYEAGAKAKRAEPTEETGPPQGRGRPRPRSPKARAPLLPPCVQCQARVGMTFSKTKSVYRAHCGIGNRRNCALEIELDAGEHVKLDDLVDEEVQDFNHEKQELIQQKMETLFGWIDEATSAKKFKNRLENYVQDNFYVDILLNRYREVHTSPQRQDLVQRQIHKIAEIRTQIQDMIREYQADPLNKELLRQAMEVHVKELRPELAHLQKLRYSITEVNPVVEMVEGFMGQEKRVVTGYQLFQLPEALETMEFEHRAPKVIKFVRP